MYLKYIVVFRFFIEGRVEGVGGWFCNPQLLNQGRIQGGEGEHGALPPKIGKDMIFFCVKWWFFTRNTPKIFAPPSARRNFLKFAPPNLKSWIRPWSPHIMSRRFQYNEKMVRMEDILFMSPLIVNMSSIINKWFVRRTLFMSSLTVDMSSIMNKWFVQRTFNWFHC